MKFFNVQMMKNPINWFVVASMAAIGLIAIALVTSPLRAAPAIKPEANSNGE